MSKLLSSKEIIAILTKHGFTLKSTKGSHCKYINATKTVIVPHPKHEIPYGTFLSIVRQSGLLKEAFN
ncbi:MAG: type II toxin-antitoxin system HicA family toxin [Candidatus Gastranaerophilaceae bacterium]|jgi:predicted RNA binding protein YcfA (HicA-like mRNA interferase family)